MHTLNDVLEYWYALEYLRPLDVQVAASSTQHSPALVLSARELHQDPDLLPWVRSASYETSQFQKVTPGTSRQESRQNWHVFLGLAPTSEIVGVLREALGLLDRSVDKRTEEMCLCEFEVSPKGYYVPGSFHTAPLAYAALRTVAAPDASKVHILTRVAEVTSFDSQNDAALRALTQQLSYDICSNILEHAFGVLEKTALVSAIKGDCVVRQMQSRQTLWDTEPHVCASQHVEELSKAATKPIPPLVRRYLEAIVSTADAEKVELDMSIPAMRLWLHPKSVPLGVWPSKNVAHLMQHLATNISVAGLLQANNEAAQKEGDSKETSEAQSSQTTEQKKRDSVPLYAIQAAQGTDPVSLIKGIIAATVVERARAMVNLDPATCMLQHASKALSGPAERQVYLELPPELKGFSAVIEAPARALATRQMVAEITGAQFADAAHSRTGVFDMVRTNAADVYFTREASQALRMPQGAWGLAALQLTGEEDLLNAAKLLRTIADGDNGTLRKNGGYLRWEEAKARFLEQLNKVEQLRETLDNVAQALECKESMEATVAQKGAEYQKNKKQLDEYDKRLQQAQADATEASKHLDGLVREISDLETEEQTQKRLSKERKEQIADELLSRRYDLDGARAKLEGAKEVLTQIGAQRAQVAAKLEMLQKHMKNLNARLRAASAVKPSLIAADDDFYDDLIHNEASQHSCPWITAAFDNAREELFYRALQVHKTFIHDTGLERNYRMLASCWEGRVPSGALQEVLPVLLESLFVLSPALITSVDAAPMLLEGIPQRSLGVLVVDQAHLVEPQEIAGSMSLAKSAVVIGDHFVPGIADAALHDLYQALAQEFDTVRAGSVTTALEAAATASRYSSHIGSTHTGIALVIQKDTSEPMFGIANTLGYAQRLISEAPDREDDREYMLPTSCWIDCGGVEHGGKNHAVNEQTDAVLRLLDRAFDVYNTRVVPGLNDQNQAVCVVSPFTSVVKALRRAVRNHWNEQELGIDAEQLEARLTRLIATPQELCGVKADEVLLVLGCDENAVEAIDMVASTPQVIDVSALMAWQRFAVLGSRAVWAQTGRFSAMAELLDTFEESYRVVHALYEEESREDRKSVRAGMVAATAMSATEIALTPRPEPEPEIKLKPYPWLVDAEPEPAPANTPDFLVKRGATAQIPVVQTNTTTERKRQVPKEAREPYPWELEEDATPTSARRRTSRERPKRTVRSEWDRTLEEQREKDPLEDIDSQYANRRPSARKSPERAAQDTSYRDRSVSRRSGYAETDSDAMEERPARRRRVSAYTTPDYDDAPAKQLSSDQTTNDEPQMRPSRRNARDLYGSEEAHIQSERTSRRRRTQVEQEDLYGSTESSGRDRRRSYVLTDEGETPEEQESRRTSRRRRSNREENRLSQETGRNAQQDHISEVPSWLLEQAARKARGEDS